VQKHRVAQELEILVGAREITARPEAYEKPECSMGF
jgi:hypothetical protein